MNRYRLDRNGDPKGWGAYQILDSMLGSGEPVAFAPDAEMAQRIVDLLNTEPDIEELRQEIEDLKNRADSIAYDIHDSYVG